MRWRIELEKKQFQFYADSTQKRRNWQSPRKAMQCSKRTRRVVCERFKTKERGVETREMKRWCSQIDKMTLQTMPKRQKGHIDRGWKIKTKCFSMSSEEWYRPPKMDRIRKTLTLRSVANKKAITNNGQVWSFVRRKVMGVEALNTSDSPQFCKDPLDLTPNERKIRNGTSQNCQV